MLQVGGNNYYTSEILQNILLRVDTKSCNDLKQKLEHVLQADTEYIVLQESDKLIANLVSNIVNCD